MLFRSHDTSSVVGAGAAYGEEALKVATTIKLTRALWIIPMAFATSFIFKSKGQKISIPWFIFFFVLALVVNTYLLDGDRKSTRLNSSHIGSSRMPSSA